MEHLQILKIIILVFRQVSGLKINLEKSSIMGINTSNEMVSRLASIMDCQEMDWPLPYLKLFKAQGTPSHKSLLGP